MICKVCGNDDRCYVLAESGLRGHMMVPSGLLFTICSTCLAKLVDPIKTVKTELDDPAKITSLKDAIGKMMEQGKIKPPKEVK